LDLTVRELLETIPTLLIFGAVYSVIPIAMLIAVLVALLRRTNRLERMLHDVLVNQERPRVRS